MGVSRQGCKRSRANFGSTQVTTPGHAQLRNCTREKMGLLQGHGLQPGRHLCADEGRQAGADMAAGVRQDTTASALDEMSAAGVELVG